MRKLLPFVVLAAGLSSGCTTIYSQGGRDAAARERLVIESLQHDIRRLEARIDGLETGQEDVHRRVTSVERGVEDAERRQTQRLDAVEQRVAEVDTARLHDKSEIVDTLSKKVAALVASSTPAPRAMTGREHTVQAGQTLSEIAAAYGVTAAAITRANKIPNPNTIRVGDKLFIPE